jgi:hypothetical protein
MANDGERNMLFDIRGRRKNVVRVVYAVLALLMGLSLLLVVGPAPITELFGGGNDGGNSAEPFEEEAARIEQRLKKDPDNSQLLLNLTRARTNAGNQLSVVNPETGETQMTAEARQEYEKAGSAWEEYVKATDEPNPSGAVLSAGTFFRLAQTARTPAEFEANVDAAAAAQQIVVDKRRSGGALSTLALYRMYAFEYAVAQKLIKEATKLAATKFERENLDDEAEELEQRARELERQVKRINEGSKGQGKETLENPLGGLGSGSVLAE